MNSRDWSAYIFKTIILEDLRFKRDSPSPSPSSISERQLDDMVRVIFDDFTQSECWEKYPDCDLVLDELSRSHQLAVMSNFDERLATILEHLGLLKYFRFLLYPANCNGHAKPNREIFQLAFQRARLTDRQHLMHIGDDLDLDYRAATMAGHRALLVDHHSSLKCNATNAHLPNKHICTSLKHLLTTIREKEKF
jgi:HAD superfamily hydrolase (TIGR01549 family)